MKNLYRLVIAGFVVAALAGCGTVNRVQTAYQIVTSATVSPQAIILAADAFDVIKITATNYVRAKRCSATSGPVCRNPSLTWSVIAPAIKTGTEARNALKTFLRTHPGQLGDQGLYDVLKASTVTLTNALATFSAAR